MIKTADNSQNSKQLSIAETATQMQDKVAAKMQNMAKQKTMRKLQKQMREGAKNTAIQTTKTAYKSSKFVLKQVMMAMAKFAKVAIATLGGGGFLVAFIAIFAIVACVIASPFGIFYSGQDSTNPDTVPVSAVVGALNTELSNKLEQIQDSVPHDNVTIDGNAADMVDVLAVFAVKYATENDVATIDSARVEQIKTVFWDMNFISYDVEIVVHYGDEGEKGPPEGSPFGEEDDQRSVNKPTVRAAVGAKFGRTWTETILHLHIHHNTEAEMREVYAFSSQQNEALDGVLGRVVKIFDFVNNSPARLSRKHEAQPKCEWLKATALC